MFSKVLYMYKVYDLYVEYSYRSAIKRGEQKKNVKTY